MQTTDTPIHAMPDEMSGDPNYMASLARGLAVIQAFSAQRRELSTSQISQKTGIPRAAVRRCLYTLSKLGFVSSEDGRHFALRPRILSLGHAYLGAMPLAQAAQPVLRHVSTTLNESSSMAILDDDDILYIARASTARIMMIDLNIGSRLPAIYTSMGRAMLSHLPDAQWQAVLARSQTLQYTPHTLTDKTQLAQALQQCRDQGFALMDQELELGLRSIAVPIVGADGQAVAAINIGTQAARVSLEEMQQRFLPVLQQAAAELALLVG